MRFLNLQKNVYYLRNCCSLIVMKWMPLPQKAPDKYLSLTRDFKLEVYSVKDYLIFYHLPKV